MGYEDRVLLMTSDRRTSGRDAFHYTLNILVGYEVKKRIEKRSHRGLLLKRQTMRIGRQTPCRARHRAKYDIGPDFRSRRL